MTNFDYRARDEAVRDLIRTGLDRTMLVEAGAGTGKTRALVDRVVSYVRSGVGMERIVAITFTEKAAAELRDRIRGQLELAARDPEQPEQERGRCREALSALDRAPISTIHAFGQSLMHQFAAEASIDPSFRVQDEVQAERHFDDAWREELRRLARDPAAAAAVERAFMLGMGTRELRTILRSIAQLPGLAARLLQRPLRADAGAPPDIAALANCMRSIDLARADTEDRLRRKIEEIIALLERLERAGDEALQVLAGATSLLKDRLATRNLGSRERWSNDTAALNAARHDAEEVHAELRRFLIDSRSLALAGLMPYLVTFIEAHRRRRQREGALTFDDLIYGPALLLARSAVARDTLRERYAVMLVDEFQDTDPLQVDIARAFATNPNTGRLDPGRLFLVGDPKQSIYRFRRADIAIYARTLEEVQAAGGELPQLQLNQRSRDIVIDWVNSVFAGIIGQGGKPQVQPPYVPIAPLREGVLAGPGVAVMGKQVNMPAPALRRHEADQIAARCAAVLEEGWQVQDRQSGEVRAAQLGDIAILIPTRTGLPSLERSLQRAGVPYRIEGGSLIYHTQEVRDLLNCLTAIDDPADEIAVVAALRSHAFACSDRDLALWRDAGGRFNYLRPDIEDAPGPVAAGLRALAQWHHSRNDHSLAALAERLIDATGLDQAGMFVFGTRDSFRRMRFVVEQARAFEADGPESLRAFVAWMERRAGGRVTDQEGAGLDDDESAVRIHTIHGSKGLEFPIVLVAGLSAPDSARPGPVLVDRTTDEVAIKLGTDSRGNVFTLGDCERLQGLERQHAEAERQRLLYVAATRARDHLVLSLYYNNRQSTSAAKLLISAGAQVGAAELAELEPLPAADRRAFAELEISPDPEPIDAFERRRQSVVDAARRERYTSATALKSLQAEAQKGERSDETEPWAHGRGGTRLGRAVHAAIQSLPLDADALAIQSHARAQAVAEAIPDRATDVAGLVERALRSDAAERARSARRALREVPFGVTFDGTIVEGFIDALVETDEGLEIIDWKTDQVPPAQVQERLRDYELQAGLYVLGIEEATGLKVHRLTYAFLSANVEASPGEPRVLAERARTALATTGA